MTIPPDNVYHYQFVHNVLTSYYKSLLDFFVSLYPRFEYKLIGTYDKAVAYLLSQQELNRETDQPNLPAIILNPSGEINFADTNTSALQLWRFPNLSSGFTRRIFIPIYNDSNVRLVVGFSRLKGEIELINLVNSYYEYIDLRFLYMQFFAGMDRWVTPFDFNSIIILPDEIRYYEYENDVTGVKYPINWEENGFSEYLIKTTNRNEVAYPVTVRPIMKLTGLSDNSDRYGGSDSLADWKLGVTVEYEIEVPSYMFIDNNFCATSFYFDMRIGGYITKDDEDKAEPDTILSSCLLNAGEGGGGQSGETQGSPECPRPKPMNNAPLNKIIQKHTIDSNAIIHNPNYPFKLDEKIHMRFYDRYYFVIDQNQSESDYITLETGFSFHTFINEFQIFYIMVGTKNGFINFYDDYSYDEETGNIILYNVDRRYSECDVIEIFVYVPLNKEKFSHPPKIVSSPVTRVNYKNNYRYDVIVEDPDPDEEFTFELLEYPEGLGIDQVSGAITWNNIKFEDIGDHYVKFRVIDKLGLTDSQEYTLRVYSDNKSPILDPIPDQVIFQGGSFTFSFEYTDENPDTVNFTYEVLTSGLTGSIQVDNTLKTFTYISENETPVGDYTVKITATDEEGLSDSTTFNIKILAGKPYIEPIENQVIHTGQLFSYQVQATDPNNDIVGYYVDSTDIFDMYSLSIDSTGLLTYQTTINDNDTTNHIVVSVVDSSSNITYESFELIVYNTPPVIDPIPDQKIKYTDTFVYQTNAYDPDNDPITYSIALSNNVSYGGGYGYGPSGPDIYISLTGEITYFPIFEEIGQNNVTVTVTDSFNATNQTSFIINVVQLDLDPIPDATVTVDNIFTYQTSVTYSNNINSLVYSISSSDAGGTPLSTISISSTGLITVNPSTSEAGNTYTIIVRVSDADDPSIYDEKSFNLTIANVNQPPIISSFISSKNAIAYYSHYWVFQASDPDGDPLSYSASINPSLPSGNVPYADYNSGYGKQYVYLSPTNLDAGVYEITYAVQDPDGLTDQNSFTVTVIHLEAADDVIDHPYNLEFRYTPQISGSNYDPASLRYEIVYADPQYPPINIDNITGEITATFTSSDVGQTYKYYFKVKEKTYLVDELSNYSAELYDTFIITINVKPAVLNYEVAGGNYPVGRHNIEYFPLDISPDTTSADSTASITICEALFPFDTDTTGADIYEGAIRVIDNVNVNYIKPENFPTNIIGYNHPNIYYYRYSSGNYDIYKLNLDTMISEYIRTVSYDLSYMSVYNDLGTFYIVVSDYSVSPSAIKFLRTTDFNTFDQIDELLLSDYSYSTKMMSVYVIDNNVYFIYKQEFSPYGIKCNVYDKNTLSFIETKDLLYHPIYMDSTGYIAEIQSTTNYFKYVNFSDGSETNGPDIDFYSNGLPLNNTRINYNIISRPGDSEFFYCFEKAIFKIDRTTMTIKEKINNIGFGNGEMSFISDVIFSEDGNNILIVDSDLTKVSRYYRGNSTFYPIIQNNFNDYEFLTSSFTRYVFETSSNFYVFYTMQTSLTLAALKYDKNFNLIKKHIFYLPTENVFLKMPLNNRNIYVQFMNGFFYLISEEKNFPTDVLDYRLCKIDMDLNIIDSVLIGSDLPGGSVENYTNSYFFNSLYPQLNLGLSTDYNSDTLEYFLYLNIIPYSGYTNVKKVLRYDENLSFIYDFDVESNITLNSTDNFNLLVDEGNLYAFEHDQTSLYVLDVTRNLINTVNVLNATKDYINYINFPNGKIGYSFLAYNKYFIYDILNNTHTEIVPVQLSNFSSDPNFSYSQRHGILINDNYYYDNRYFDSSSYIELLDIPSSIGQIQQGSDFTYQIPVNYTGSNSNNLSFELLRAYIDNNALSGQVSNISLTTDGILTITSPDEKEYTILISVTDGILKTYKKYTFTFTII